MKGYQHILLAVDLSDESHTIAERAKQLASFYDARISVIHVVEHVPMELSGDLMITQPVDFDAQLVEEAKASLDRLVKQAGLEDVQRWVEIGSMKNKIIRAAEDHDVDLLVLGSHSRHGLSLLLGSTTKSVLANAPCDVLAVHIDD